MIKVYFTSTQRLTRCTPVGLLLKFWAIKQENPAWSEVSGRSGRLHRKPIQRGWRVIQRGGRSSGRTAHLATPPISQWGKVRGHQTAAGQRGTGTFSMGRGLFCLHVVGGGGVPAQFTPVRHDPRKHVHSSQSRTPIPCPARGRVKAHPSLIYHCAFQKDGHVGAVPEWGILTARLSRSDRAEGALGNKAAVVINHQGLTCTHRPGPELNTEKSQ